MIRKVNTCWAGLELSGKDSNRIKKCNKCGSDIVFLQSAKSGKWYPVNFIGIIDVDKTDFHKCNRK